MTPATAFLKSKKVLFSEHTYEYVEHGGTEVPAKSLGVPEHQIVKTLVMEDEAKKPLVVSMGNVAGSGGYYVACGSDTIFADRATMQTKPEHAKFSAYYNLDNGTGAIRGIYLQETIEQIRREHSAALEALGVQHDGLPNRGGVDIALHNDGLAARESLAAGEVELDGRLGRFVLVHERERMRAEGAAHLEEQRVETSCSRRDLRLEVVGVTPVEVARRP